MEFELWSVWHFLYMLSPAIIFAGVYFSVRNRSERTKYIVGATLGVISILILVIRNVDILVREGWDLEVIPLQVCHIGSLVAGLAIVTRKRWMIATAFCFNTIPAYLAMVFADSLANYDTLWRIRPQTYVWGHILIIVCALYGIFVLCPRFKRTDLYKSMAFVGVASIAAVICNSAFRVAFSWEPNYFYLYDYNGTPLKFLYEAFPSSSYGWFNINWFYALTLVTVFVAVFVLLFVLAERISHRAKKPRGLSNRRVIK